LNQHRIGQYPCFFGGHFSTFCQNREIEISVHSICDFLARARSRFIRVPLLLLSYWVVASVAVAGTTLTGPLPHEKLFDRVLAKPSLSEWQALAKFDGTLTKKEFERRLDEIYAPNQGLRPYLRFEGDRVLIFENLAQTTGPLVAIRFASPRAPLRPRPTAFRSPDVFRAQRPTTGPQQQPLAGLRIAIEPADIGGHWAQLEDRSVVYSGYGRINEGDLNLTVGRILRDNLRALGADVFLIRDRTEPVLPISPDQLMGEAESFLQRETTLRTELLKNRGSAVPKKADAQLRYAAGLLLTKTLETRARVDLVRQNFVPDLTIVLQHNATNDSGEGKIAPQNRNIFFVNGAYLPGELVDPQKRLRLVTKLLENDSPIEVEVAHEISKRFQAVTAYPPVLYGNSANTRILRRDDPYVLARNLAFNREHDGPVVVTEPYFMNHPDTLRRLLAGDYVGKKTIAGKPRVSIFREYADCVTEGILKAYGR